MVLAKEIKKVRQYFKIHTLCITKLILLQIVDIYQLKQEISALEELSRQLFLEAHDTHNALEKIEWSQTWTGKYFNFLGYFFSLYCMWKIFIVSLAYVTLYYIRYIVYLFQCTINIVFDRVGKKDPVTRGIEIAVHWMGFDIDVIFWSQHVSFFLIGCIVVTSIRGLLLTLTKVHNTFRFI